MKAKSNIIPITTLVLLFALLLSYTLLNMHAQGFDFINFFTSYSNDMDELFNPSDNLLKHGIYSLDGVTPYTDRIPGISIIYIPLKFLFPAKTAFTLLTLIPLFMQLGIILFIFLYFSKKISRLKSFLLSAGIIFLTPFYWFSLTYPESYSIVFTVIGFLILFDFSDKKGKNKYIFAGMFFMLSATFRGYLMPSVFALTLLFFIYYAYSINIKIASLKSLLFILPLLLYLGIWTTRNYTTKSELIVLQTNERGPNSTYKPSTQETKRTLKMMGFETVEYYTGSPTNYILGRADVAPEKFFNQARKYGISENMIDSLRKLSIASYNKKSPAIEQQLINYNTHLKKKLKEENSIFNLYLITPLKVFGRSLFHNFTQNWGLPAWNNANIIEKIYRLSIYAFFHITFLFSFVFSIIALLKKQNVFIALSWLIWISSMFFTYTYFLNNIEFKYYLSLFPMSPIIIAILHDGHLRQNSCDRPAL